MNKENVELDDRIIQKQKAKILQLEEMEMARKQKKEMRKMANEAKSDPTESADKFWNDFTQRRRSIESGLSEAISSKNLAGFASVSEKLLILDAALSRSSYHLPAYDVRVCQDWLSKSRQEISEAEAVLQPKKKFSFGSKKQIKEQCLSKSGINEQEEVNLRNSTYRELDSSTVEDKGMLNRSSERKDYESGVPATTNTVTISHRQGEVIFLPREKLEGNDIQLRDLDRCTVYLPGPMAALFIHKVQGSKFFCGPILGAAHVEDMADCVLMAASHQIRIHKTKNTDLYLRMRSRPIVEHTSGVRFAPFLFTYSEVKRDLEESGLLLENGLWEKVDDFRWLRAGQSPNWSVLPEAERCDLVDLGYLPGQN